MRDVECLMDMKCAKGHAVCCAGCDHIGSCPDACANSPELCKLCIRVCEGVFSGEKMRAFRVEAGLSEHSLAYLIQTRAVRVRAWESGELVPSEKSQRRLCGVFKCNMLDLRELARHE